MDMVLVHGSYHGAWCWDFLRPELERLGHRITTMDMPISDPTLGAADYAKAVADSIPAGSKPIVIGHSMAGIVIPLVADLIPVRRLVFLAGFLPEPGLSANDQRAREAIDGLVPPKTAEWTDLGDDVWAVGPNTATELFFHDAKPAVARWATSRLRAQSYRVMNEPTPMKAWPDVERSYVVCRTDRALNPDWCRTASRERLGIEPIEIDGAHSPFLTRPAELAQILHRLA